MGTKQGDLACNDERKNTKKYFRRLEKGDICTNIDDYTKSREWCLNQYKELQSCKRRQ